MSAERKSFTDGVDMQSLPPDLAPLNPYFGFDGSYTSDADLERSTILAGLMVAADHAPTEADLEAVKKGERYQWEIDFSYERVADVVAASIDPNYHPLSLNNHPMVVEVRDIFHGMIRPLSAEKINRGVDLILQKERRNRQSNIVGQVTDVNYKGPVVTSYFSTSSGFIPPAASIGKDRK